MARRKICVVTGSRADYGHLYWLLREIEREPALELQLAVTGMHLSPAFGSTWEAIARDGFRIDARVDTAISGDTPADVVGALGRGVIGFAEAFGRLQPDIAVVLGDRYEILAAAEAALVFRIPLAHIAGGDSTEGAFDEAIRHSITKMAQLHFVTHEQAARRVAQLGEDPASIFNVGSLGIDTIKKLVRMDRAALERALQFSLQKKNLLVTFHPVTLGSEDSTVQFVALLEVLAEFHDEGCGLLFTRPNADTGNRALVAALDRFVADRRHAKAYDSLGQDLYLNTMAQVDAVVGNSSSGLYEAPSFGKPTVNVGDRQKGRVRADSVIDCPPERGALRQAIRAALAKDCSRTINPYGDGRTRERIVAKLRDIPDPRALLKKHFFELRT